MDQVGSATTNSPPVSGWHPLPSLASTLRFYPRRHPVRGDSSTVSRPYISFSDRVHLSPRRRRPIWKTCFRLLPARGGRFHDENRRSGWIEEVAQSRGDARLAVDAGRYQLGRADDVLF